MPVKASVLKILEENPGKSCSGEEIAGQLSVTRAAVWKAVRALLADGCEIESCPSHGYRLISHGSMLCESGIQAFLKSDNIEIIVLDTVDSTNNYAKTHPSDKISLITADSQTGGRGRRGRSFFSPKGSGIYMSLILHPDTAMPTLVTVAAAVAVARTIERISGRKADIKWVNDIFLGGKKVCGILSEAVFGMESGTIDSVIVGIGVNLSTEAFPDEITGVAGSVFPDNASRCEVIADITNNLLALCNDLSAPELIKEYKSRMFILGRQIEYTKNGSAFSGIAEDINSQGNLIVRLSDGTDVLSSGEVSLKSAVFAASENE